jgi:(1->4)-alpha-D-glucan 1-alpha-D-glucosylmutase
VTPDELHAWAATQAAAHPEGMTTLSTHDTKRSEDVRARLALLTEVPGEWSEEVAAWREAAAPYRTGDGLPDATTEYLLWQTLVGAWPLDAPRLLGYLEKATREAKLRTSWTSPDAAYDTSVRAFAEGVLADEPLVKRVTDFVDRLAPGFRANVLAQKLVQLTLPGVPDIYQGCELVDLSLVDPDNRRAVDYQRREQLLATVETGRLDGLDAEKLLVTTRALRLRRERADLFGAGSSYEPLPVTTAHAFGFVRGGEAATLVTRLPMGLQRAAGWPDTAAVALPEGRWTDRLTGTTYDGGGLVRLADVFATLPVALLVRDA